MIGHRSIRSARPKAGEIFTMLQKIILFLVSLFALWMLYHLIRYQIGVLRQRLIFQSVFKNFKWTKPSLKISRSYGYPHFTVTFKTKYDMDKAQEEGFIKQFTDQIQEICQSSSDSGTETWSFDAERAIFVTYEG